jgi:hypothetical protein
MQGNTPCIWAEVDSDSVMYERTIETFGTGHNMPGTTSTLSYIGTYQTAGGRLVFHVYERRSK